MVGAWTMDVIVPYDGVDRIVLADFAIPTDANDEPMKPDRGSELAMQVGDNGERITLVVDRVLIRPARRRLRVFAHLKEVA